MSDEAAADTATRTSGGPADAAEPATDTGRDPDAGRSNSRGSDGIGAVAPWIVAVVAAAVAIVALVQWWQVDRRATADQQVREVAGQVVAALTNWQADDLEAVRGVIAEHGTDRFAEEAGQLLDQFAQGLQQAEAQSTGEILNLVADAQGGGDSGVALAIVRQEITNAALEQPDVQCWGTRVLLQERDSRWLVEGVELYGPNQCPAPGDEAATGDTSEGDSDG